MLIEIKTDVFLKGKNKEGLNFLLRVLLYKRRYEVFVDFPLIKESEVFQHLLNTEKEIFKAWYNRFILESKTTNLKVNEEGESTFTIDEAIRFLIQPVGILLENSKNDAHFLKALFKLMPKKSTKKINKHLDNGWLQFENAGGATNIKNFINGKLESFNSLPKDNYKYLRIIVIRDSDKQYPEQTLKKEINDLIEFLESNEIPYHILEKREMENYLPRAVLETLEDAYINTYLTLSAQQQDYFDLEKGFDNENRNSVSDDIKVFYKDIIESDWNILQNGSSNKNFKSEFPTLFGKDEVTRKSLLERTKHQSNPKELEEIIKKINQLL